MLIELNCFFMLLCSQRMLFLGCFFGHVKLFFIGVGVDVQTIRFSKLFRFVSQVSRRDGRISLCFPRAYVCTNFTSPIYLPFRNLNYEFTNSFDLAVLLLFLAFCASRLDDAGCLSRACFTLSSIRAGEMKSVSKIGADKHLAARENVLA